MLTCHELFGFMPGTLAVEILEATSRADKPTYQTVLNAVAAARKVRPEFLQKKPRADRHRDMTASLATPRFDETAALLLRQWLTAQQAPLLGDFLDRLAIPHRQGIVEEFPATVETGALSQAVDALLAKYPPKTVAVYLHSLLAMELIEWPNLASLLQDDARLQLA